MTLAERIDQLVEQHGSLRAVARMTGIEVSYLSRLRAGEKVNPLKDTLRRLGLRRVVTYEPTDHQRVAPPPSAPEPSESKRARLLSLLREWKSLPPEPEPDRELERLTEALAYNRGERETLPEPSEAQDAIIAAARDLYDNRLGWGDNRNPYAPPHFWDRLGAALAAREGA